jgi:hypothetical protein
MDNLYPFYSKDNFLNTDIFNKFGKRVIASYVLQYGLAAKYPKDREMSLSVG